MDVTDDDTTRARIRTAANRSALPEFFKLIVATLGGIPGTENFYISAWSAKGEKGDQHAKGGKWGWSSDPSNPPREQYMYRGEVLKLLSWIAQEDEDGRECYFVPHFLPKKSRRKDGNASPIRALWADMDEAPAPETLPPSFQWETSPGRTQAIWLLKEAMDGEAGESLNKRLTYDLRADKSGWPLNKLLRIPGTHHRKGEPFLVTLTTAEPDRRYTVEEIEGFLAAHKDRGSADSTADDAQRVEDGRDVPDDSCRGGRSTTIDFALSDDDIIAAARRAKNGAKFSALLDNAGWERYYPHPDRDGGDWSKAVEGISGILAFYTQDAEQIKRIVANSPLCSTPERAARWARDRAPEKAIAASRAHYGERVAGHPPLASEETTTEETTTKERSSTFLIWDYELDTLPTREWLVEDLIGANELAMLFGAPGSGKSLIALSLAHAIGVTGDWFGRSVKRGTVVYIAGEGVQGLRPRLEALVGFTDQPSVRRITFAPRAVRMLEEEDVTYLLERIREEMPEIPLLIIVDTLSRAIPGADENSQRDMSRLIANLDRPREETGAAVLLIHHGNRAGDYRGSSVSEGAVDTMIEVSRNKSEVTLKCNKQKESAPFDPISFTIASHRESVVLLTTPRDGLSEGAKRLLSHLKEHGGPDRFLSTSSLEEALHKERDTIGRWGKELAARDLAEQVLAGRNSGWQVVVSDLTLEPSDLTMVASSHPSSDRQPPLGGDGDLTMGGATDGPNEVTSKPTDGRREIELDLTNSTPATQRPRRRRGGTGQ